MSEIKSLNGYLLADTTARQEIEALKESIAALGTPVFGTVDADNNIILSGALADGAYTLKYDNADGTTTLIGTLTVGGSGSGDSGSGETFNVPITWIYNTKLSKTTGEVESANDGDYNASDYIDLVAGASYVIATSTDCYNAMNIVYYDDSKSFVGYQAECWAANSVDNPDDGNPQSCALEIPDGAAYIRLRQFETWNTQGDSTKYITLTGTMP